MSISILLVPAVAAATAAAAALTERHDQRGEDRVVCQVQTRMRDAALLAAALRDTRAVVTGEDEHALQAEWQGVSARFVRDEDGIWTAHFTGDVDRQRAIEIVTAVDAAYGRHVQQTVIQRLRDRAPAAGLRLESETVKADASVELVFTVEARA